MSNLLTMNETKIITYIKEKKILPINRCSKDIFKELIKNDCCESIDYVIKNLEYKTEELEKSLLFSGEYISFDLIKILENNDLLHIFIDVLLDITKNNPDKNVRRYLKKFNKNYC